MHSQYYSIPQVRKNIFIYPVYNKGIDICIYSSDIPASSADFTSIIPRYRNALFQSHLPREKAEHFLQHVIHILPIFILPGTHSCWVTTGSVQNFCRATLLNGNTDITTTQTRSNHSNQQV